MATSLMKPSYLNDPTRWEMPQSMQCAGAEIVTFMKFDDQTDIVAEARGMQFREVIKEDGPLVACGRLSRQIRRYFEFGKRRRLFRAKQRSIRTRNRTWL